MLELGRLLHHPAPAEETPAAHRYLQVALRQRDLADQATLPQVRERLLRSAEKWEFLASSYDSELARVY